MYQIKTFWNETVIEMAESKGALIAKTVQKHAGRAKEKVFIVFFLITCVECSSRLITF